MAGIAQIVAYYRLKQSTIWPFHVAGCCIIGISSFYDFFPPFTLSQLFEFRSKRGEKKGKRYGLKLQIGDELILILNLERKEFFSYLYE